MIVSATSPLSRSVTWMVAIVMSTRPLHIVRIDVHRPETMAVASAVITSFDNSLAVVASLLTATSIASTMTPAIRTGFSMDPSPC